LRVRRPSRGARPLREGRTVRCWTFGVDATSVANAPLCLFRQIGDRSVGRHKAGLRRPSRQGCSEETEQSRSDAGAALVERSAARGPLIAREGPSGRTSRGRLFLILAYLRRFSPFVRSRLVLLQTICPLPFRNLRSDRDRERLD
jgi:hypothetical protein